MRRSNLPWNQTYPFSGKCQAQCHNLMWFCTLIWGLLSTVLLVRSDDCLIQNDFDWLQNSKPNRQALSGRQQMSPTSGWHGHHDGIWACSTPTYIHLFLVMFLHPQRCSAGRILYVCCSHGHQRNISCVISRSINQSLLQAHGPRLSREDTQKIFTRDTVYTYKTND